MKQSKSKKKPLGVHQKGKTITSCPTWFFGGPHQWDNFMANCKVKRRQKPPYQYKWSTHHEWGNGSNTCIHCGLTRAELKPKPTPQDKCTGCGVTRQEAQRQASLGSQPKLGCEEFGHKVNRGRLRPGKPQLFKLINLAEERKKRRG